LRYSDAFIQKVIEANDLVDIISQHTQLKPSGSGLMGRCPFPDHPEKTASFSVSPTRQVYHCFGCHKSGNVITFLKDYNGLSFREAIEYLAEKANIELPKYNSESSDQYKKTQWLKSQIVRANTVAAQLYHNQLKSSQNESVVTTYIKSRGLTHESIEQFQLGFADDGWDTLVSALSKEHIQTSIALKAELIRKRTDGSGYYDFFRSRLMFPIHNSLGQVIAFGGRVLDSSQPKYLNTPETPAFQKSKNLYGLYQATRHIRSQDRVILVEGYMDVIALHQAGLPIAVAPMGTALTAEQAKILARTTRNIIVLFDGDSAGQSAAIRSLPILFQAGLLPKGLFLPEGLDPDDFVKKFGIESLKSLIDKAPDLFTALLQNWLIDYRGSATEKVQWTEKLTPIFQSIPNDKLRKLYQNEASWKLGLPENWWASGNKKNATVLSSPASIASPLQVVDHPSQSDQEHELQNQYDLSHLNPHEKSVLQLMLNKLSCWNLGWNLEVPALLHSDAQQILQKAKELTRQNGVSFDNMFSLLTAYVKTPGMLFMDSALQNFYETEGDEVLGRYFLDLVKKLQDHYLKNQIENIKLQLKSNPAKELFNKLNDLVKLRQSLQKKLEVTPLKLN